MTFNVLMDLGKLKNPYSGLGQFSYNYGKHIVHKKDASLHWNFLVPKSGMGIFNKDNTYEQISLKRRFLPSLCKKYHLWHALHQDSPYMPANTHAPYILTIHDLNFLEEKKTNTFKRRLKKLQQKVDRATAITCVSKYSADVTKENLNLEGKDLIVIHNGVDIDTEKRVKRPDFLPNGKFLFTLGMVLKKKNFHVLIDFIYQLPGFNLVIAGDKTHPYAKEIQRNILKNKLQDRVIMPGAISEEEKIYLYRHCKAFLFPSKIEGFGLPVVEAMRFGKPVFISRHSSLPEIGGDLAYYWDSFNPDNMAIQFESKLRQFELDLENHTREIIEYSQKYDWESCIEKYFKLYIKVINEHYNCSLKDQTDKL
jgi:glycosyltransferase involved in cell wall biosynthesis